MAEEKNELKTKVNDLEYEVTQRETEIKGFHNAMQVLYETERHLKAENKSLRDRKGEMFGVSMSRFRSRRSGKESKKIASTMREKFVGIGLQVESMFSTWYGREFAELKHFAEGYVRNCTNRGD